MMAADQRGRAAWPARRLLLATPARLFDVVMPFLLLLATLTFAFGARAGLALASRWFGSARARYCRCSS